MKKQLLIYALLLSNCFLVAQPSIQWQRTFGGSLYDEARSVSLTLDNGYFLFGQTVSDDGDILDSHGYDDFWAIKLDSVGSVIWKKAYGGTNSEIAYDGIQTSDGGYILTGYTESNDDQVSGNHGDRDLWVLKLDVQGNIEWQHCYGGSKWEEAWDVKQTADGGYILAGLTTSNDGDVSVNHGTIDYWVVKLDSDGQLQWQKTYGGSNLDYGYTIALTLDGGYIVGGEAQSTDGQVTGNPGGLAAWIVKLNFEGKIEWQKALGGTGIDRINEIIPARAGGYTLIGNTRSNNGDVTGNHGGDDMWIVKISEFGDVEWQRALGGSSEDYGMGIIQTTDGGYVATGIVNSNNGDVSGNHGSTDLWLVKLSESGDLLWQRAFGGTLQERGFSVKQTPDGGYAVFGDAWSNNGDVMNGGLGKTDYWFLKLAPESSPTSTPLSQPLDLFPNPAQQSITVQIPAPSSTLWITVSDVLGLEMRHRPLTIDANGRLELELATWPSGVYIVSARAEDGQLFTGKFVKE